MRYVQAMPMESTREDPLIKHFLSAMESTREDPLIKLFLSAYENGSWADACVEKPDAIDRTKQAVDQFATRKSDRKTLAIEHTIIEPFADEKGDFASFLEAGFLRIEEDESLVVPGRLIEVFVPVGTLRNQPQPVREAIIQSVHAWIKSNRLSLADGTAEHVCPITGLPDGSGFDITLTLGVTPLRRGSSPEPGVLHVRRQKVDDNLGQVVEKALRKKLPKLISTPADKHILLLERQHMNLYQRSILDEIQSRRASFPELAGVDEIWIVETMFYEPAFGGMYLRFELYENSKLVRSLDFQGGRLVRKSEDGVAMAIIQQEP